MNVDAYLALRRRLDRPTRRRLTHRQFIESLCPRTIEEDSAWPTPTTPAAAVAMMSRLSQPLWGVCAGVAVDAMGPIWWQTLGLDTDDELLAVPYQAIRAFWRLRHGWAEKTELRYHLTELDRLTQRVGMGEPIYSIVSAVRYLCMSGVLLGKGFEIPAASFAFEAAELAEWPMPEFVGQWWQHCRCQMAFHGAGIARLD